MKKVVLPIVAAALALALLTGCAGKSGGASDKTAEELKQLYTDAITQHGGEMVEYNPVISQVKEDDLSAMILEVMGLQEKDMKAFGISASLMNTKAYGIAAVMPNEGKEEAVRAGLQEFINYQKQSFEQYLTDQYEIAKNAKLETLKDGTILMVMCENQDAVFDAVSAAIQEG